MPQQSKINLLNRTYGLWLVRTSHVIFLGNKTYRSEFTGYVTSELF